MEQFNYNDELYHHGIKGMRWGVRRFQNKDGSLTPAGEKRYNNDTDVEPSSEKKKSKHRLMLEEKYKRAGLSDEVAQREAAKRIRTEKILAGVAGITIAAAATYAIRNGIKNRMDGLIEKGDDLQRIEMRDTNGKLNKVFYASMGEHDNARYKGILGYTRQQQTGEAYIMQLQARKNIKVASKENATRVFGDLIKNDPEFEMFAQKYTQSAHGKNIVKHPSDRSRRNIKKMYENFNSNLPLMRNNNVYRPDEKFYKQLKKAGYGAIQDVNDMKYSGYNAKNPLIIFDKPRRVKVKSMAKLDNSTMASDAFRESSKALGEGVVKTILGSPIAAVSVTALATSAYMTDYRKKTPAVSKTARVNDFVNQYRSQHPNTQLTDREIKAMISNKNKEV